MEIEKISSFGKKQKEDTKTKKTFKKSRRLGSYDAQIIHYFRLIRKLIIALKGLLHKASMIATHNVNLWGNLPICHSLPNNFF